MGDNLDSITNLCRILEIARTSRAAGVGGGGAAHLAQKNAKCGGAAPLTIALRLRSVQANFSLTD